MRLAQAIQFGGWLIIAINLLMALGCIGIFMRMAPAVEEINLRNYRSLEACEVMLDVLAESDGTVDAALLERFRDALSLARANVTESGEGEAIQRISRNYQAALRRENPARTATLTAIRDLSTHNREAMVKAAAAVRQLGMAGAWGVVFMALLVLLAGLLFKRRLARNLVVPLEEIKTVIAANRAGDLRRRCSGADLPRDVEAVFNEVNELLDRSER